MISDEEFATYQATNGTPIGIGMQVGHCRVDHSSQFCLWCHPTPSLTSQYKVMTMTDHPSLVCSLTIMNFSSCVQWSDRWHLKQPKHLFKRLSPVITITQRYAALLTFCFGACSRSRTLPEAMLRRDVPRCFGSKRVPVVACVYSGSWPPKSHSQNTVISC